MLATKRLAFILGCAFLTASITDVRSQQRTTATFDQWTLACENGNRTCEVVTAQQSNDQSPVAAQITVSGFDRDPVKISIQVAPNVWIAGGIKLLTAGWDTQITAGFRWCVPGRCLADADLRQDVLLRLGNLSDQPATLVFQDASQREQKIPISFKGLRAALDARARQSTGASVAAAPQAAAAPPPGSAGKSFDGAWSIDSECQAVPPDVPKAAWKVSGRIQNGHLLAKWGNEGKPGSGKFEGDVKPDGALLVTVSGLTDDNKANVYKNAPFNWEANGILSSNGGTASRIVGRYCVLNFAKGG